MPECRDKKLGALLHAYELSALPEYDAERFEVHLLACEHCLNEVKRFSKAAALIRSDGGIRDAIEKETITEERESESIVERVRKHLWPDTPVIFRPAFSYLLILLLAVPAYRGFVMMRENRIRQVLTLNLFPDRSSEENVINRGNQRDGLIGFIFRGALPGGVYRVIIKTEGGKVIFRDDAFSGFDEYETGRLLLPVSRLDPGEYRLIITDTRSSPPLNEQVYLFSLEE